MAAKSKATEQYEKNRAEVDKQLSVLRANLKRHAAKQKQHPESFGHAGDLVAVYMRLRDINDFLK